MSANSNFSHTVFRKMSADFCYSFFTHYERVESLFHSHYYVSVLTGHVFRACNVDPGSANLWTLPTCWCTQPHVRPDSCIPLHKRWILRLWVQACVFPLGVRRDLLTACFTISRLVSSASYSAFSAVI